MQKSQIQDLKSKALYYKENKELLQISSVRIPFFLSVATPTSIIAIPTENHQLQTSSIVFNENGNNQYQKFQIDRQQIMLKTYYAHGTLNPKHTIIIIFKNVQTATQFYQQYNQLPICSQGTSLSLEVSESKSFELEFKSTNIKAFYCKDVSNLSQLFFDSSKNYIAFPESQDLKQLINITSKMIIVNGIPLEQTLKSKKIPILSFMDQKSYSTQHMYYRWRTYSYMQGDGDKKFRTQKFKMIKDGAQWFPPVQRPPIKVLNIKERLYFTNLAAKMNTKKNLIQEAMCFCIRKMASAVQIVEIISIWVFENPLPLFMLISDIFFNTTTPVYRNFFSVLLPKIIYRLKPTLNSTNTQKIKSIIQLWTARYIYQEQYLKGLIFILDQRRNQIDYSRQQSFQGNNQRQLQVKNPEIQTNCHRFGIPFFEKNPETSQKMLKQYQLSLKGLEQKVPNIGIYDGEQISEKEITKIKTKLVKTFTCSDTSIGMLFQRKKHIQ